jgi:hypothetical protein
MGQGGDDDRMPEPTDHDPNPVRAQAVARNDRVEEIAWRPVGSAPREQLDVRSCRRDRGRMGRDDEVDEGTGLLLLQVRPQERSYARQSGASQGGRRVDLAQIRAGWLVLPAFASGVGRGGTRSSTSMER